MLTNTKIQIEKLSDKVGRKILNVENISLLELKKEEISNLFKSYGVLLFRGFGTELDTFAEFSNSLSTDFLDYTGGAFNRKMINEEPTILTVTDFKHEVKLHEPIPLKPCTLRSQKISNLLSDKAWIYSANPI